uniref:Uncharacterized protein n=1 Tax=Arundo donax TaxID=35708 RepID=A0A0A9EBX1_ARUDO
MLRDGFCPKVVTFTSLLKVSLGKRRAIVYFGTIILLITC